MENLIRVQKGTVIYSIVVVVVTAIVIFVLSRINKSFFSRLQKNRPTLHLVFFEQIVNILIFMVCVVVGLSFFSGADAVWKSLLGGTAFISAVLVFVAQDIIKDMLAGLMISIYKPFEIGNRITLENGQSGIVKDITMRHIVIHTWGSQELIIPNSKINTMQILNDSFNRPIRSYQARFHIAYPSDVEKAMEVIKQAIMDSEYTVKGFPKGDDLDYSDIYFTEFADSSLVLSTTIYYKEIPTEVVRSDVNLRVNKALKENHIEIPYPYINVVNYKSE